VTRILAVIRRIFLAGIVSLIVSIFIIGRDIESVIQTALALNSIQSFFCLFFSASLVLYFLFVVFSVIFIRHHGQFAVAHKEQAWFVSFFRCIGSDLVSPFKNIGHFFTTRGNRTDVDSKNIFTRRFVFMLVLLLIFVIGILSLG
jgi:hypothetical protein